MYRALEVIAINVFAILFFCRILHPKTEWFPDIISKNFTLNKHHHQSFFEINFIFIHYFINLLEFKPLGRETLKVVFIRIKVIGRVWRGFWWVSECPWGSMDNWLSRVMLVNPRQPSRCPYITVYMRTGYRGS